MKFDAFGIFQVTLSMPMQDIKGFFPIIVYMRFDGYPNGNRGRSKNEVTRTDSFGRHEDMDDAAFIRNRLNVVCCSHQFHTVSFSFMTDSACLRRRWRSILPVAVR